MSLRYNIFNNMIDTVILGEKMERKLKLKKSAIIFGQSLSIFLKYLKPMLF